MVHVPCICHGTGASERDRQKWRCLPSRVTIQYYDVLGIGNRSAYLPPLKVPKWPDQVLAWKQLEQYLRGMRELTQGALVCVASTVECMLPNTCGGLFSAVKDGTFENPS